MNVDPVLNYTSLRAQKARFAARFGSVWHMVVALLAAALFLAGLWVLLEHGTIGWVLIGLSGPLIMITVWWQGDLKQMAISAKPQTLDDVMAADLLGQLPSQPTPKDIAEAVGRTRAGQFLAVRLGITPNFLSNIASEDRAMTDGVWRSAVNIWRETNSPKITGAIVAAAIIEQFPAYDALLANMRIELSDVKECIRWYERIKDLIEQFKQKPLRTGGIARDWSFGFTPLLSRFAQNLSQQVSGGRIMSQLEAHQSTVDQMIRTFSSGGR